MLLIVSCSTPIAEGSPYTDHNRDSRIIRGGGDKSRNWPSSSTLRTGPTAQDNTGLSSISPPLANAATTSRRRRKITNQSELQNSRRSPQNASMYRKEEGATEATMTPANNSSSASFFSFSSTWANLVLSLPSPRRFLAEKYHPDKDEALSCETYGNQADWGEDDGSGSPAGRSGSDATNLVGDVLGDIFQALTGQSALPPCRGDYDASIYGGDDDDEEVDEGEDDSSAVAPAEPSASFSASTAATTLPSTVATTPAPTNSPTPAPTPRPYVSNLAKVSISVALPEFMDHGIPKSVTRAVTRILNISSALREEDMLTSLLQHVDVDSHKAEAIASFLQLASTSDIFDLDAINLTALIDTDDLPVIIPEDQSLWFQLYYGTGFRYQQPDWAFHWGLVHIETQATPVPADQVAANTNNTSTMQVSANGSTSVLDDDLYGAGAESTMKLGQWWQHTVSYKAYKRDENGLGSPLTDSDTLDLLEEQMELWLGYHINRAAGIFEQLLHKEFVVGVTLPGNEYEVYISDDFDPHMSLSLSDSSEDGPYSLGEDDRDAQDGLGTVTEPLLVQGEGKGLETPQEWAGLVVLLVTLVGACLWTIAAHYHAWRKEEQALWGSRYVGTEQALEEVLNVGWTLRDEELDDGPRQVLEIFNREGLGYRDDDSMLYGGVAQVHHGASAGGNARVH